MKALARWGRVAAIALVAGEATAMSDANQEKPVARRLTLLQIADTHAQLETHPEYLPGETPDLQPMGGFARLKTAVDRARKDAAGPAFFVDGGDTFQGSAPAAWSQGEAVVGPLNALGLDVCVPGNWEPVYGAAQMKKLLGEVKCTVLAYNLADAQTEARLYAPSAIVERGGIRVAFVGITDPTTTERQPPAEVRGLDSTRMGGLHEFVQALRAREKPDLVVAVTHTGLTVSRQLARDIPEFDVVLSGHTHERTWKPILEGRTIVVEPGSMGSFLGRLDLVLAPGGGVASHRYQLIPVKAAEFPEDPAVKSIVDAAVAPFRARMAEVVARTRTPILRYDVLETAADDLIADAMREVAGADIGTTNGFRFSPPIPPGPVTEGDLWSLLPLDARTKAGWVTGRELREYLERELELVFSTDPQKLSGGWGPRLSGATLSFAARAAPGHRLRSLKIRGREVGDGNHITFAGCERDGEPLDIICRLRGVHEPRVLPWTIHQVLGIYFTSHPVVAPVRDGRSVAIDLPATVFSQDTVLSKEKR